jgi:hypothetical protein
MNIFLFQRSSAQAIRPTLLSHFRSVEDMKGNQCEKKCTCPSNNHKPIYTPQLTLPSPLAGNQPIKNPKTYSYELADVAEDNLGMYEYFLVHGASVQVVGPTLLFALLEGVGVLKRIGIRQTVEVLYIMSPSGTSS